MLAFVHPEKKNINLTYAQQNKIKITMQFKAMPGFQKVIQPSTLATLKSKKETKQT